MFQPCASIKAVLTETFKFENFIFEIISLSNSPQLRHHRWLRISTHHSTTQNRSGCQCHAKTRKNNRHQIEKLCS